MTRVKQTFLILLLLLVDIAGQERAVVLESSTISLRRYEPELNRFRGIGLYLSSYNSDSKSESTRDTITTTQSNKSNQLRVSIALSTGKKILESSNEKRKWLFYLAHSLRASPNYNSSEGSSRRNIQFEDNKTKNSSYGISLTMSSFLEVEYRLTERISFFNQINVLSISGSATRTVTKSGSLTKFERWKYNFSARITGGRLGLSSVGLIYFF